jgi:hypothetical protein
MLMVADGSHIPGRIRSVPSTRLVGVHHWGVEGWFRDATGQPTMWHAQKNDVLRCTSYAEFSAGQPSKIEATPATLEQQRFVIERLERLQGLRWNLASANCEQIVRWAYEGRAHSNQLATGVVIAVLVGGTVLLASAS